MDYRHMDNKPMMKASYKHVQIVGSQHSGKELLAAMFNSCGTRPYLSDCDPGLTTPREIIFDPWISRRAPAASFIAAMQMLTTKITGSYLPQELVDKIVNYLSAFHPRPGQRAVHLSVLRTLGTDPWPQYHGLRRVRSHPLDDASITVLCYNKFNWQSFVRMKEFWDELPGRESYQYLRKWVVVVCLTNRDDEPGFVVSHQVHALLLAQDVRRTTSSAPPLPDELERNHFYCDPNNLSEVEHVFEKIVGMVSWTQLAEEVEYREYQEQEERQHELRQIARRQRLEAEEERRKIREEKRAKGLRSRFKKLIMG